MLHDDTVSIERCHFFFFKVSWPTMRRNEYEYYMSIFELARSRKLHAKDQRSIGASPSSPLVALTTLKMEKRPC
jgi:hypothetical protein